MKKPSRSALNLSLLSATLDASLDGILLVDHRSRKVLHYNPRFLALWGIPGKLAARKDDKRLLQFVLNQLKSPQSFLALVEELYRHPKRTSEDELLFKDGRVFERHSEPISTHGKVVARVWFFRNITAFKTAQAQAMTRADQLRNLFDNLTEGVVARDQQGVVTQCNASTLKMLGLHSDELLGSKSFGPGWSIMHADRSPCGPDEYPSAIARTTGRQQKEVVLLLRRLDGLERWINTTATPVRKKGQKPPYEVLITFRDVTDKVLAEQELNAAEAKLIFSAKMSSLGAMAGGIAHEINNPLTIIRAKATQLKRSLDSQPLDPGRFRAELTKIESTTDRIDKIVKGLRLFSRNAEGDPMEGAVISSIVSSTIELWKEGMKHRSIDLRVRCETDAVIECRPAQISQIIMNLVSNAQSAVEALPEKWIVVDVTATKKLVQIAVTDSGRGIPPAVVEKIMEPFFTTKETGKGTGLGLSISKGIAEDHRGHLRYDPTSTNTRFVLELPRWRGGALGAVPA